MYYSKYKSTIASEKASNLTFYRTFRIRFGGAVLTTLQALGGLSTIQAVFVDNHPTLWRGVDAMCE